MPRNSIVDFSFSNDEVRVIRMALLQFIVEERKCIALLNKVQCGNMAACLEADAHKAEQVLNLMPVN
jgi:hypothetical protein